MNSLLSGTFLSPYTTSSINVEFRLTAGAPEEEPLNLSVPGSAPSKSADPAAEKFSRFISLDQFVKVYRGIQYANYLGYVLNAELTIVWKYAGVDTAPEVERMNNKLMDRIRKFLKHRNVPLHYYGVFENGAQNGYHFHAAIHVPRWYKSQFMDCLKRIARRFALPQHVNLLIDCDVRRTHNTIAQWKWFQYCMKGLDPVVPRYVAPNGFDGDMNTFVGVQRRNTGVVEMDRVRIARALGPKARWDSGYVPKLDITQAPWDKRYTDDEYMRGIRERSFDEARRALEGMELV